MKKEKSEYYPAFDLLRIILALLVAVAHSGIDVWEQSGNYAVQVFFALSGWLIGGILIRSTPTDLSRFYFNRAARIWIPYFFAIVLLVAASLLKDRITIKWFEFFFYDVTFVYNFFGPPQLATSASLMPLDGTGNHFWSICAEEQFYLVAPFLITISAKVGRSIWFWCIVSTLALASPYWGYFGSISLGVLASVLRARLGDWQSTQSAKIILAILFVTFFFLTFLDVITYRIGAPLSSVSIVLLLAQAGPHSRLLSFVGGISFPMYLNHWIGTFVANALYARVGLRETIYSQITSVIVALMVGAALYLCMDRVIKANRDRYFTERRGKTVAACGYALVLVGLVAGLCITQ